ncbi:MAG: hypothetical protein QME75_06545, partial [Deltaproteobacteria bacterium]|nr:hypothetical protein [Deltaproteobacteria bacterium]
YHAAQHLFIDLCFAEVSILNYCNIGNLPSFHPFFVGRTTARRKKNPLTPALSPNGEKEKIVNVFE